MIPTKEEMQLALEKRYGKRLRCAFSASSVAVCGLGGLGSSIAVSLARAGIGRLILIDYDSVEIANLHRQQYKVCQVGKYKTDAIAENLKEIAPYTTVITHNCRITVDNCEELLGGADIICEAFDCAEEKAMLINCVLERMSDKYIIAASGMAGLGSPNSICTRRITEHFYLCGDGVSDVEDHHGLMSPRVLLCAAHQAQTVLRILAGKHEE